MHLSLFVIILFLAQFIALATSIIYYPRYNKTYQRYFLHLMAFVVLVELSGFLLSSYENGDQGLLKQWTGLDSRFIYNVYIIGSFLFFFYWFSQILEKHQTLVSLFTIGFGISIVYCILFIGFFDLIWLLPILVGGVFTIILSCLWYAQKLTSDDAFNFLRSQKFWIVTGLLIFHLGIIPLLYFQNYVIRVFPMSYGAIIMSLNIILYGCITFSFLCLPKK